MSKKKINPHIFLTNEQRRIQKEHALEESKRLSREKNLERQKKYETLVEKGNIKRMEDTPGGLESNQRWIGIQHRLTQEKTTWKLGKSPGSYGNKSKRS